MVVQKKLANFFLLAGEACLQQESVACTFDRVLIHHLKLLKPDMSSFNHYSEKTYLHVWAHMTSKVISAWQGKGEIPKFSLRLLLNLITLYFEEKTHPRTSPQSFSLKLLDWTALLRESKTEDRHCLYGQLIQVNEQPIYLIEIILNGLFNSDPNLDAQMIALARWLGTYDASLISSRDELSAVYAELKVGPAFTLTEFRDVYLSKLISVTPLGPVHSGLNLLLHQLQHKISWDHSIVAAVAEIYRLRWSDILGRDCLDDYLSLPGGANRVWVRLAELLCGAGLLDAYHGNYYRLLMPTLKFDQDLVQQDCVTNYPLSHYILSSSTRYLILLDNSVSYFAAKDAFYNCNTFQPKPFTRVELSRMKFAGQQFHSYIPFAEDSARIDDPSISIKTVLEIKALIDTSFYPKALQYGHTYTSMQLEQAGRGFHLFYNFLKDLTTEERERLQKQRILVNEQHITFFELFESVGKNDEDGCIAGCGRFLTQLVLDYNPLTRFNPEIEERVVSLYRMRENSRKKTYGEYDWLGADEAKRRLLMLAVSIMSRPECFSLDGEIFYLWDCSKRLFGEYKEIFKVILPLITRNRWQNAQHVYAMILESFVKPALHNTDRSWLTWVNKSQEKTLWLESILDESMFQLSHHWVKPELLLSRLFDLNHTDFKLYVLVEGFLDELVQTNVRKKSLLFMELRVNIKFQQLLKQLNNVSRQQVLDHLESTQEGSIGVDLIGLCKQFLAYRVASVGVNAVNPRWQPFFFRKDEVCHEQTIKDLLGPLLNDDSLKIPQGSSLMKVVNSAIKKLESLACHDEVKAPIKCYLQRMKRTITPMPTDRSTSPIPVGNDDFLRSPTG